MKTILFLLALTFNIFLCLYPGHRLPSTPTEKTSESASEIIRTRQAYIEHSERQGISYSAMLKGKATELSQK